MAREKCLIFNFLYPIIEILNSMDIRWAYSNRVFPLEVNT